VPWKSIDNLPAHKLASIEPMIKAVGANVLTGLTQLAQAIANYWYFSTTELTQLAQAITNYWYFSTTELTQLAQAIANYWYSSTIKRCF
jgi:hypothetical protein